jgi:hypothetical protein
MQKDMLKPIVKKCSPGIGYPQLGEIIVKYEALRKKTGKNATRSGKYFHTASRNILMVKMIYS